MLLNNHKLGKFDERLKEYFEGHIGFILVNLAKYEIDTLFVHTLSIIKSRIGKSVGAH